MQNESDTSSENGEISRFAWPPPVTMGHLWLALPLVILIAAGILLTKTAVGIAAGLLNGWSKAGTTQLGFLLADGKAGPFQLDIMAIELVRCRC